MCFVRKGMDWVFTQQELKWLDDIMPESHSRAKEDAKKKETEEVEESKMIDPGAHIQVPLQTGNLYSIPVDRVALGMEMEPINISEEMAKTTLWKTIVANESAPSLQKMDNAKNCQKHKSDDESSHHSHHKHKSAKKNKMPVQFYIDEEEKEQLLDVNRPAEIEIVVDPPSLRGSMSKIDEDTQC